MTPKHKVGDTVRIGKSEDYHLQGYEGKEVTITSLPGEDHSFLYRIEWPDPSQEEGVDFEYASEKDLVSL